LFAATSPPTFAAEDTTQETILFNQKVFADMGDTVHVEGQVTGEGIGYKINRNAMTCYRDRKECILTHVDTQGRQAFSIGPPLFFDILKWDKDLIVADLPGLPMPSGHPCGGNPGGTTWYIHRDIQSTLIQENFCDPMTGERGFYKWTIEDDPFWHKFKGSKEPAQSAR
jgi:hypothetical protein